MKILAIRIRNLASLEGTTEIDFTHGPLAEAGIFSITGQTGAGKSTILDALCLALYAKTPRYAQAKEMGILVHDVSNQTISQHDVRGILRDNTSEGFAEVDFIGIDKTAYRARWAVKRSREKVDGALQADTVVISNLLTERVIESKKTLALVEIERLVGLTFEQFTRSILLAQGDFTAFLKANKDEKAGLLEKLTGTQIYSEISKLIFAKNKEQEQELRELNLRREGIETLQDEEIVEINKQIAEFQLEIDKYEIQIKHLDLASQWFKQLSILESGVLLAEEELLKANQAVEDSNALRTLVYQVNLVQPAKTWVDALAQNDLQFEKCSKEINIVQNEIPQLEVSLKDQKELIDRLQIDLDSSIQAQKHAKPKLVLATSLDARIQEVKVQLDQITTQKSDSYSRFTERQALIAKRENELQTSSNKVLELENWFNKFDDKKLIAQEVNLISNKLLDAERYLKLKADAISEKKKTDEKSKQISLKIQDGERLLETKLPGFEKEKDEFFRLLEIQNGKNIVNWESKKAEKEQNEKQLISAQFYFIELQKLNQKIALSVQEIETLNADLVQKKSEQEALNIKVRDAKVALVTSEELLKQAQLKVSENVERLRNELKDNEPCLVCGSTSHPYKNTHSEVFEGVLEEMSKSKTERENVFIDLNKRLSAIESGIESTSSNLKKLQTVNEQDQVQLQKLIKIIQEFAVYEVVKVLSDDQRVSKLNAILLEVQAEISSLTQEIVKYKADEKVVNERRKAQEVLEHQINQLQLGLKDLKHQAEILNADLNRFEHQINIADADLNEIKSTIHTFFQNEEWWENWQKDPKSFVHKIQAFAKEWNEKQGSLQQLKKELAIMDASLAELRNSLPELHLVYEKALAASDAVEKTYSEIQQSRAAIFAGKPVAEIENQLESSITNASNSLENSKKQLQLTENDLTKKRSIVSQLEKSKAEIEEQKLKTNKELDFWVNSVNSKNNLMLNLEAIKELFLYDLDWRNEQQAFLKNLESNLTKAISVKDERTKNLINHKEKRSNSLERSEIEEQLVLISTEKHRQQKEKNSLEIKLANDQANKQKIGSLLKLIEEKAEAARNWAQLNELIGSADGIKFRRFAQEFTLDVLLGYANKELQALTKRYKIERIPNTLALLVVDKDMGGELRTVFSLSGGESFLVSLALALGLAALSSSKVSVESLFIDEGFGALDPETLNVAIDALERLHNQGRKVGVISHVQEMKERIPTQIMVTKMANGRSKIDIKAF